MPRVKDLTNKKFGRLTVVNLLPTRAKNGKRQWRCRCECGGWSPCVDVSSLTTGNTKSCGCVKRESSVRNIRIGHAANVTHGQSNKSGNSHYSRFYNIKQRTGNPNCKDYPNYGGRGIFMHHTWIKSGKGFERFKWYLDTVLGPCPDGMTLDRKDNDQGYEPANLQWATPDQQNANRRISK